MWLVDVCGVAVDKRVPGGVDVVVVAIVVVVAAIAINVSWCIMLRCCC